MGLNQISMFEAKVANGNGEQSLSRDIYRLGHRFDFFRMLSCYFTTVGFYFSSMVCHLVPSSVMVDFNFKNSFFSFSHEPCGCNIITSGISSIIYETFVIIA